MRSARHAVDAEGVHGPKRCVVGGKSDEEMPEPERFVEFAPRGLWIPIVNCREEGEDRTADEHVVEVSNHEVGIVEVDVKSSNGEEHTRDTTEGEGYEEPK